MRISSLVVLVFALGACRSTSPAELKDGPTPDPANGKKLTCEFSYRTSTSAAFSAEEKKSCSLGTGGGAAALPDEFSLGGMNFRFGCDSGFFVGTDLGTDQHHQVVHQNVPPQVANGTGSSHGFTGLNYVYSPSGAEVQYFCWKNSSNVSCSFNYRPSVSSANFTKKSYDCQLQSGPGATAPDEFSLGDIDFRVGCDAGIFIGADHKGEQLHQVLHQDITSPTHGVTGLNYVYSPKGEEVQYWCTLGN